MQSGSGRFGKVSSITPAILGATAESDSCVVNKVDTTSGWMGDIGTAAESKL